MRKSSTHIEPFYSTGMVTYFSWFIIYRQGYLAYYFYIIKMATLFRREKDEYWFPSKISKMLLILTYSLLQVYYTNLTTTLFSSYLHIELFQYLLHTIFGKWKMWFTSWFFWCIFGIPDKSEKATCLAMLIEKCIHAAQVFWNLFVLI